MTFLSLSFSALTVDELVALDSFLGVEVDDRRHQNPLLVGAPRVDRERLAELDRTLALVNVPVQGQQGLVLVDGLTDSCRADRAQRAPAVHQLEVRVEGRRLIEARAIRRAVEVEDGVREVV